MGIALLLTYFLKTARDSLYLDASALVKRYVAERGSQSTNQVIAEATLVATASITRAEVAAALAKAVRTKTLSAQDAYAALLLFRSEWERFIRIQLTESILAQADALAWEYGLRGYDAVHLASALFWQQALETAVILATFDLSLWRAAGKVGLRPYPADLPDFLSSKSP